MVYIELSKLLLLGDVDVQVESHPLRVEVGGGPSSLAHTITCTSRGLLRRLLEEIHDEVEYHDSHSHGFQSLEDRRHLLRLFLSLCWRSSVLRSSWRLRRLGSHLVICGVSRGHDALSLPVCDLQHNSVTYRRSTSLLCYLQNIQKSRQQI